jgi:hypothetical protein
MFGGDDGRPVIDDCQPERETTAETGETDD